MSHHEVALETKGLGRHFTYDHRAAGFPMSDFLDGDAVAEAPASKVWKRGPVLDQGREGACVGFAWTAWRNAEPVPADYDNAYAQAAYKRAQQIDEWPGECVDTETEVLTERGWLRHDQLEAGDRLFGLDLEAGGLRTAEVQRVHRYESKAYRVWSQRGLSIAVTDNHKWVVTNRKIPGRYDLVETTALRSMHAAVRSAPSLEQPFASEYSDDFVEMVAWAICEGHYRPATRKGNGICITQKTYREHVTSLMARMGVAPGFEKNPGEQAWELSGGLATMIREVAPEKVPDVRWLQTLTQRQLRLFIETCILADGNVRSQEGRKAATTFSQKKGPILDAFLTACVLAGQPISRAAQREDGCETWTLRGANLIETRKLQASPYITGPVWCPESELGTFVARRGGTIFLTGNSYSGTSVQACAKVMRERNALETFAWAGNPTELSMWVRTYGPVVFGMKWRQGSYRTDSNGFLQYTGEVVGGHALCCIGVDERGNFVVQNSWGTSFGHGGICYVTPEMMQRIYADGQWSACTAIELGAVEPPKPDPEYRPGVHRQGFATLNRVRGKLLDQEHVLYVGGPDKASIREIGRYIPKHLDK